MGEMRKEGGGWVSQIFDGVCYSGGNGGEGGKC